MGQGIGVGPDLPLLSAGSSISLVGRFAYFEFGLLGSPSALLLLSPVKRLCKQGT
jgi:hypothetical protein